MQTCVILAGGKSSRMGRDKTLLPFGSAPTLTHFQFDKFSQIFSRVFVSSKFDKFSPPLPLITDENLGRNLLNLSNKADLRVTFPDKPNFKSENLSDKSDLKEQNFDAKNAALKPLDGVNSDAKTEQKRVKNDEFSPMLALASVLGKFSGEHVFIVPADMPFVSAKTVNELYKFTSDFDIVIAADERHSHSLCGFFSADLATVARELYENGEHKIGLLHEKCRVKKVKFNDESEFYNINTPSEYEIATKGRI